MNLQNAATISIRIENFEMREGEGHENWVGLLMNLLARILSGRKKKTTLVRSVGYSFCIVVFLHRRILLLVSFNLSWVGLVEELVLGLQFQNESLGQVSWHI